MRVPFSQLTYVEVNGKHLYFNLADGQVREVVGSMKEYEDALLTRPEFMRIHRSYIVNLERIESITRTSVQIGDVTIPVSDQYKDIFSDYISRWT